MVSAPQAKETTPVPTRAGHRLGDLGKTSVGLAIPGKAVLHHHHPLQGAVPLSDQDCARPQGDAVARRGIARDEGRGDAPILIAAATITGAIRLPNSASRCLADIAERGDLDALGQDTR